ncbi:SGNH/GDSL hydrolase family protein [Bartonella tamiae]|uniref:SGNH hydrolase-type esterase domain-containing protein n=1 Tax=Bartonella tamiae Th239 TaxID=1094558 RepID=J0ZQ32_9HYPH|nr:SGNH/GDSL hydrolase family protein [Bartonella tamiae]EJF90723.1 hypothetical protein ME5_01124 [Bartonella tamiae Th239]EJF93900.1 hypothetical protein MEG_00758 [Bartonella tamiae Th307]
MTKTILAYGDSLTWGVNPLGPSRHESVNRWPVVLQTHLSEKVTIIAEGLRGRTTVFNDYSVGEDRQGARILPTLLATHQPVDLVIILLGTNDLKSYLGGSAASAAQGMRRLIEIVRTYPYLNPTPLPEIIIVSPPHLVETADQNTNQRFINGISESKKLAMFYSDLCDELECSFFDAASVAYASSVDGIHLDETNSKAIGKGLAPIVRMVLGL